MAVFAILTAEDINDTDDFTDSLLPHSAAGVSFQSAQRTEWSFCRTQCSRYYSRDMYHIRKHSKHIK